MANLKDLIVNGVSRFIGKVYINDSQITMINGSTVGDNPKFTDTVTTITTTGDGNAITDITASNGALAATKGTTFFSKYFEIEGVYNINLNTFEMTYELNKTYLEIVTAINDGKIPIIIDTTSTPGYSILFNFSQYTVDQDTNKEGIIFHRMFAMGGNDAGSQVPSDTFHIYKIILYEDDSVSGPISQSYQGGNRITVASSLPASTRFLKYNDIYFLTG